MNSRQTRALTYDRGHGLARGKLVQRKRLSVEGQHASPKPGRWFSVPSHIFSILCGSAILPLRWDVGRRPTLSRSPDLHRFLSAAVRPTGFGSFIQLIQGLLIELKTKPTKHYVLGMTESTRGRPACNNHNRQPVGHVHAQVVTGWKTRAQRRKLSSTAPKWADSSSSSSTAVASNGWEHMTSRMRSIVIVHRSTCCLGDYCTAVCLGFGRIERALGRKAFSETWGVRNLLVLSKVTALLPAM